MCFHNSLSVEAQQIKNRYKANFNDEYNFKPIYFRSAFEKEKKWPIIANIERQNIQFFNWGLIPDWTLNTIQAQEISEKTINAKSETVFEKSSFKHSIIYKRCLVPSTGFFEWQHEEKNKYPWFIKLKDLKIFSLAGIWAEWKEPKTNVLIKSFSILTCEANELMSKIHNTKKRMPVILSEENEENWLSSDNISIKDLLKPYDEFQMEAYTVAPFVSSTKHDRNIIQAQAEHKYFITPSLF